MQLQYQIRFYEGNRQTLIRVQSLRYEAVCHINQLYVSRLLFQDQYPTNYQNAWNYLAQQTKDYEQQLWHVSHL